MHSLNISTSTLNLIASYLTDRTQYVEVNEEFSSRRAVRFGVPQGSILETILFNIYVSDLKETCDDCICVQYADDFSIASTAKQLALKRTLLSLKKQMNL